MRLITIPAVIKPKLFASVSFKSRKNYILLHFLWSSKIGCRKMSSIASDFITPHIQSVCTLSCCSLGMSYNKKKKGAAVIISPSNTHQGMCIHPETSLNPIGSCLHLNSGMIIWEGIVLIEALSSSDWQTGRKREELLASRPFQTTLRSVQTRRYSSAKSL